LAPVVPLIPIIATVASAGLGVATAAGAFGKPDAPKVEIPKPQPAPGVPRPQQAPPPAGPRQEVADLQNDADREAAAQIAAARRKRGRKASVLTSTPLGGGPQQPQGRFGRPYLGS
jgi:hypothetical protein